MTRSRNKWRIDRRGERQRSILSTRILYATSDNNHRPRRATQQSCRGGNFSGGACRP